MTGKIFRNIAITGLGITSSLGMNAMQANAAIRAGIKSMTALEYYQWLGCPPGEENSVGINISPVPTLDPFLDGQERICQLGVSALSQLVHSGQFEPEWCLNSGLFLALPEVDKVINSWSFNQSFIEELVERTQLNNFKLSKYNQFGSTGVFYALSEAADILNQGVLDFCIVGGVDSFLLKERLELIDKQWRLKTPRNIDGFIPGEGATTILLETVEHAKQRGAKILALLDATGFAVEENTFASNKNSTAKGLTSAIRDVLAIKELPLEHIFEHVHCSLNGESYYASEWALVKSRLGKQFDDMKDFTHHASSCGELGAATGGMLIANATSALLSDSQACDEALLWTSADNGQRMALNLRKYSA